MEPVVKPKDAMVFGVTRYICNNRRADLVLHSLEEVPDAHVADK